MSFPPTQIEEKAALVPQASDKYPDGNPKTIFGMAKPPLVFVPPVAILKIGQVMQVGAAKYGPMNWRDAKITQSTYINAALRHIYSYMDGQDLDRETHLHELAHAAAGLCILLDAMEQGVVTDDRPTHGTAAAFIARHTKGIPPNDIPA